MTPNSRSALGRAAFAAFRVRQMALSNTPLFYGVAGVVNWMVTSLLSQKRRQIPDVNSMSPSTRKQTLRLLVLAGVDEKPLGGHQPIGFPA